MRVLCWLPGTVAPWEIVLPEEATSERNTYQDITENLTLALNLGAIFGVTTQAL